jgi:hypothetical protein
MVDQAEQGVAAGWLLRRDQHAFQDRGRRHADSFPGCLLGFARRGCSRADQIGRQNRTEITQDS